MQPSVIHGLSGWDYAIIGWYLVFVSSIGFICRRLNKNASDYFRGGGNMVWWVGALSAVAASISTWSFTGGAAKCYKDGFVLPVTQLLGAVPSLIVLLVVATRFRRLRVITAMEAVFRRFGFGTEQFYTWFSLPMGLFWGGIGLNTVGVFMASAFHLNLSATIVIVGVIVTLLSTLGGQWAVALGGVVQGVLLMLVVFVVAFLSLRLPQIGGLTHLTSALPARHLKFDTDTSGVLVWLWIGWSAASAVLNQLDLRNCGKFVRVKDDQHAKRMVLLMAAPTILLVFPIVMQLPSMCAATVFPDLKSLFPNLSQPEEGAWVAMAFKVLPQGLLGLMVCAMFSAATDSADAALNTNAGFFVRNVYIRYLDRTATEKRQVIVGKVTTVVFGGLFIGVGLGVNALRTLNLFDLFQLLNALLLPPMIVPMVLGLFIRRTPAWAGWSTVLVGLVVSMSAKAVYSEHIVQQLLSIHRPLSPREFNDGQYLFVSILAWLGATLWFLATIRFWKLSTDAHHARVDELFNDLHRPVTQADDHGENLDAMQYRVVGALFLILGVSLLLCMVIPNPLAGRLAFLFVGGVLTVIGACLWALYRRTVSVAPLASPTLVPTVESRPFTD